MQIEACVPQLAQNGGRRDAVQIRADASRQQLGLAHARRQRLAAGLALQPTKGVGHDRRGQPQRRPDIRQGRRFLGQPVVDPFRPGIGADQVVSQRGRIILPGVQVLHHRPQHFGVAQRNLGRPQHRPGAAMLLQRV
jgi:hypothetical protein